jgi:hypothetical protein
MSDNADIITALQQGFAAVVSAIHATNLRIERLEESVGRELRILTDSVRSMDLRVNERLNGMDAKLADIRENTARIEERQIV